LLNDSWPVAIGALTLATYHIMQGGIGLGANHGAPIGHQLDITCEHNLHGFLDTVTHDLGQSSLARAATSATA
jgi:hypothetical protein